MLLSTLTSPNLPLDKERHKDATFKIDTTTRVMTMQSSARSSLSGAGDLSSRSTQSLAERRLHFKLQSWIGDAYLKCCRCNSFNRDIRLMPCFHTICARCLEKEKFNQQKTNAVQFACPICVEEATKMYEQELNVLRVGVHSSLAREPGLGVDLASAAVDTPNAFVQGLHELALCLTEHSEQHCDYCKFEGRQSVATKRCVECGDDICDACASAHKRTKLTRMHSLVSYEDIRTGVNLTKLRFGPPSICQCCTSSRNAAYFCFTCSKLLCLDCRAEQNDAGGNSNSQHIGHHVTTIERATESVKHEINQSLQQLEDKELHHQESIDVMQSHEVKLKQSHERVAEEISKRVQELHEHIDTIADEMLASLDQELAQEYADVRENMVTHCHALIRHKSAKVYLEAMSNYGRPDEILCSNRGIRNHLESIMNSTPQKSVDIELNVAYEGFSSESHMQTADEHVKQMLGNFKIHRSHGNSEETQNPTQLMDHSAHSNVDDLMSMQTPSDESCRSKMEEFQFIPPQKRRVSKVEKVLEFEARAPTDTRDIWPTGVAVQRGSGNIFVLDRDNNKIKIFTQDGDFLTSFGGQTRQSNHFGVYCADSDSTVSSTSNTSEEQSQLGSPFDLTFSDRNKIYVTDYHYDNVKVYTSDGLSLGTMNPKNPFKHPRGISCWQDLIAVVDSRRKRVCVYDTRTDCVHPIRVLLDDSHVITSARRPGDESSNGDQQLHPLTEPFYCDFVRGCGGNDALLAVSDWAAPSIKLFSMTMNRCVTMTGAYGNGPGQLLQPYGICSDASTDSLYVADHVNHRVQWMSCNPITGMLGEVSELIGKAQHDLWHPMAIALDDANKVLVVTEALGSIKVFTLADDETYTESATLPL